MGRIQQAAVAAAYLLGSAAAFIIPSGKLAPALKSSTSAINAVQSQRYVDISFSTHLTFDTLPTFLTNDAPRPLDPRLEATSAFDDFLNSTNLYRSREDMNICSTLMLLVRQAVFFQVHEFHGAAVGILLLKPKLKAAAECSNRRLRAVCCIQYVNIRDVLTFTSLS